jgi:hypothetical protein
MRPWLRPAIAPFTADSTAGLSHWAHRVGVMEAARARDTPT